MPRLPLVVCACLLLMGPALLARTWYILPDGTGDTPTIKAGLDSASYGDTVLVAPGTYLTTDDPETWICPGPGACLTSEGGAEVTIIEICGAGCGIGLGNCEGARVSGFTVRYRDEPGCMPGMGWPTGILLWDCRDVVVEDCIVTHAGAYGIQVSGTAVEAERPSVRNNRISHCAYGLDCDGMFARLTPLFEGNVVTDCTVGISVSQAAPRVDGNVCMYCWQWGMQFLGDCGGNCTRNVIAYNGSISEYDLGGIEAGRWAPILNQDNLPEMANDIYCNTKYDVCAISTAAIHASYNYWGSDCPDFPSMFKGEVNYRPWVDSAHTIELWECPQVNEPTTWGAIKSMYR